jgi:solute carrier family 25 (mitochondrial phosphate transporter), member 23/24/25/41
VQVTYPLDTLRLRLAVDPAVKNIPAAVSAIIREGGLRAMYRGVGPAMLGIAPYMALEFATYDSLPQQFPAFARGFTAALLATSCCYPMDTLRRQIQVQTGRAVSAQAVVADAWAKEGFRGLYRGFLPNALKNLPNKGMIETAVAAVLLLCIFLANVAFFILSQWD